MLTLWWFYKEHQRGELALPKSSAESIAKL